MTMEEPDRIIGQIQKLLADVMAIDVASLEKIVQRAHETTAKQRSDPPERFAISRQVLRMFWHFRSNLEAVETSRRER